MVLIRPTLAVDQLPALWRGPVALRPPQMSDFEAWAMLRSVSRRHLIPYEPSWLPDELTRAAFRERIRRYARELRSGQGYAFLAFRADDGLLVGGISLANVRRGVSQTASVGYWIGAPYVRRGYGRAALRAAVDFAFEDLGLNRIEAAVMPVNTASLALLEQAGFRREGLARQCLKIRGAWEDHVSLALVASDWREGSR